MGSIVRVVVIDDSLIEHKVLQEAGNESGKGVELHFARCPAGATADDRPSAATRDPARSLPRSRQWPLSAAQAAGFDRHHHAQRD